jgi:pSer/pThr/pTyr-binding forkhead associated (FHA) protein
VSIPTLEVQAGPNSGASYAIPKQLVLGRSRSADLVLADEAVSREHASVRPDGVTVVIEDLGSANGTWVNGEQIDSPCRVEEGDLIQVGDTTLALLTEDDEVDEDRLTPSEPTVIRPPPGSTQS